MSISLHPRILNAILLTALMLSLLSAWIASAPARAGTEAPEPHDDLSTPLTVEVAMAKPPAVGETSDVTIVVASSAPASGVQVEIIGSDGLRVHGESRFVIDLAGGESRALRARVTPEAAGNHSVAANASLDLGDGSFWGDSDAVYFHSGEGVASEGYRYAGERMAGAAVPGPGNAMRLKPEAYADGSMPALAVDADRQLPVDTGEPGGHDDAPAAAREEASAAAGKLTIRGNVGMLDRSGQWKNQMLLVELLNSSGNWITWTYSDLNGNFVFHVDNPGQFRIRFWANYTHSSMQIGAIRVVGEGLQTPNRFSWSGWHYFTPLMGPFPSGEVNVSSWQPDPSWDGRRAWWVYQDLIDAWLYVRTLVPPGVPVGSRHPDGVTAEWEPGSTANTEYNIGQRRIKLEDKIANSAHIVLHEYGHAVMHNVYGSIPNAGCPSIHWANVASAANCAWVEGWASFFSIAVTHDPLYKGACSMLPCSPAAIDYENRHVPGSPWEYGDTVEGNVTASLWDFIDPYIDGADKTNSGFTPLWKIWDRVYTTNHETFAAFWFDWYNNVEYARSLATLYQNTIDYGWSTYCPDHLDEIDDNVLYFATLADPSEAPYQRAFCTENDVDWYKLEAVAGDTFVIETSLPNPEQIGTVADPTLTLYRQDPHSFTQLAFDDNGGQNLGARIEYTAPASGDLFVAVRHATNLGDPSYRYAIDFTLASVNQAPSVSGLAHALAAGPVLGSPSEGVYTIDVRASWTASDPDDGIAYQTIQRQVDGGGFETVAPFVATDARSAFVPVVIGANNQLRVSATDTYGLSSEFAVDTSVDVRGIQETNCAYEGVWTGQASPSAWGGAYMRLDDAAEPSPSLAGAGSASAHCRFSGTGLALVGMAAPDGGRAQIYIDGEFHGMADFYADKPLSRQVLFAVNDLSDGEHELEIRWIHASNEHSTGYRLYLDGLVAIGG